MDKSEQLLRRSKQLYAENQRIWAESQRLIAEARQRIEHLQWVVASIQRQWNLSFHRDLHDAIRAMHGCEAKHLAAFAVRQVRDGEILWEGMVEEFALIAHPAAERCYAWHYQEDGKKQSFSLLKLCPVDSPQRAVQLSLLAREQRGRLAA